MLCSGNVAMEAGDHPGGRKDPWNTDTRVLRTWAIGAIFQMAAQVLRRQEMVTGQTKG